MYMQVLNGTCDDTAGAFGKLTVGRRPWTASIAAGYPTLASCSCEWRSSSSITHLCYLGSRVIKTSLLNTPTPLTSTPVQHHITHARTTSTLTEHFQQARSIAPTQETPSKFYAARAHRRITTRSSTTRPLRRRTVAAMTCRTLCSRTLAGYGRMLRPRPAELYAMRQACTIPLMDSPLWKPMD